MTREEAIERAERLVVRLAVPGHSGGLGMPEAAAVVKYLVGLAKADAKVEALNIIPASPSPEFFCKRCGAVGYYQGVFSAARFEAQHARFEAQHARFEAQHKSCPPTYLGGGI